MMARITEIVPGCSVSSDFIVGHPGETEESFLKSVEAVKEFRFKNSFIFKYSPRPGTKAFERLADDVPEAEKRRRNNLLLAVQNEISEEDNATFIGREVEVFVDGPSKKEMKDERREARENSPHVDSQLSTLNSQLVGRTRCDRLVVFDGNPALGGNSHTGRDLRRLADDADGHDRHARAAAWRDERIADPRVKSRRSKGLQPLGFACLHASTACRPQVLHPRGRHVHEHPVLPEPVRPEVSADDFFKPVEPLFLFRLRDELSHRADVHVLEVAQHTAGLEEPEERSEDLIDQ